MAFSQMKIIKPKYRSRLTDRHLTDCLKLAVSSYEPDFRGLTDSIQSQPSHWVSNIISAVLPSSGIKKSDVA